MAGGRAEKALISSFSERMLPSLREYFNLGLSIFYIE